MITSFILIALCSLLSFSLGRTFGKIETSSSFNRTLEQIISAMRSVETLATLRGEDLSKLSVHEIAHRTKRHLDLKLGDE